MASLGRIADVRFHQNPNLYWPFLWRLWYGSYLHFWTIYDSLRTVRKRRNAMGQYYEIVSIQRAEPPPDGKGSNWYCYVIAYDGRNPSTGYRQGSLKAVTSAVVEMIAQLNERHWKKRDREKKT